MGKDQFVIPHEKGWAVKGAGNKKATKIHKTQKEAIKHAKKIAKNQESEVVIKGRNNKIRQKNSYGNDPYPPRG